MNLSSYAGLIGGLILIAISIIMDGDITRYFDISSILIVFGGTIASTVVSYSFEQLKAVLPRVREVFSKSEVNLQEDSQNIIRLAMIARREGLLALDNETYNIPFLQKGIELIVDGTDPEMVRDILERELDMIEEQDQLAIQVFNSMAQYAPAFGMVGTLIGLINMLMYLDNSDTLGPSMAVALITTFYGVILANLVFLPFVRKIKTANTIHQIRFEMILTGILAIQNGENPRIIREKLQTYIPSENEAAKEELSEAEAENEQQETVQ